MPRNVEIKARVSEIQVALAKVAGIADQGPFELAQDDTFFRCEFGRIKLRQLSPDNGQLIFYQRSNEAGPKESFFVHSTTIDPTGLREVLSLAYGRAGRVIKQRIVYHVGRTRIHIDRVEGLGEFLELEVALSEEESIADGTRVAEDIMARIGIAPSQLIDTAYVDLLLALHTNT